MTEPVIFLDQLSKTYVVPERDAGVMAAARSLVKRRQREIKAVDQVSFAVGAGEIVGFLGPNGAGKTTTLKMLAGLLHPTGGVGRVLDYEPWQRKRDFLRVITLVMGQRNQLNWDIPASDSFELNRVIYRVPLDQFRQTLGELTELLELGPLVSKPVRNLSLGERMKCEIAAALLHRPRVLFLDEPTIGLDVTAQRRIREFVREYNQRHNATILLTSHYMADVEALCQRVVVIHHGRILFDGLLPDLITRFSPNKTIKGINFWPGKNYEDYLRLKSRVENRMALMSVVGTELDDKMTPEFQRMVEENPLLPKQAQKMLEQLQITWDDVEVSDETLGLNDLSLEQFRQELFEFFKKNEEFFKKIPNGVFTGFKFRPNTKWKT
ncbi:MAG: ATP-binding cassette domain-containing protein, partial [Caldilinea sp. CFX5]|nr:ATP-binding cassette domain-containing protein [Caldilinea sp. CFX5]